MRARMLCRERWMWIVVLLVPVSLAMLPGCREWPKTARPLTCHVGGTMRPVMQKLAEMYEKETGQHIEINSARSSACWVSPRSGAVV